VRTLVQKYINTLPFLSFPLTGVVKYLKCSVIGCDASAKLVADADNILSTDYTYSVLPLRFAFSRFILITLMIILITCHTCVFVSLALLQTARSVKILTYRSLKAAESRHIKKT